MRGFLGGVSIGALVSLCGAAMWSLSTPLPPQISVSALEPSKGAAPQAGQPAPVASPQADADLVEAAPAAPASTPIDDLSGINAADTAPSARPELTLPGDVARAGDAETPDQPNAPRELEAASGGSDAAERPQTVEDEDQVVVSTASPQAPTAADSVQQTVQMPDSETALPNAPVQPAPAGTAGDGRTSTGGAIAIPELGSAPAPTAPPVISFAAPAPGSVTADSPAAAQEPTDGGTEAAQPAQSGTGPASDPQADAGATDRIAALPTADGPNRGEGPQIGSPVIPLTERDSAEDGAQPNAQTPFEAFAEPFDADDGRPLMSIVLIDDAQSVGAEALTEFPYPLTFAIDPEDPRATEKMAQRRAAGFEVLILADLPRQAQPQDAETALQVWLDRLPEAVGILEGVKTGVQGNRPLADQVADVARSGGFGLLLQNNGLNTVQKLALRDGVPAGVVFRDFDGAGQNPRAMRRFLDQAAFRAGQEGAVIMLGRVQPDTISALLLWGLQDRASRVALAPVSAGLKANLAGEGE